MTSASDFNQISYTQPTGSAALAALGNAFDEIGSSVARNNAFSVQQAEDLRNWQYEQNQKAMEFNALEAARNRDWQHYMANTAHQREVADLKAAGLNPVLSAMGGNGAAVGSGATASGVTSSGAQANPDQSGTTAIVNLMGSMLGSMTNLAAQGISAASANAIANKNNALSEVLTAMNNATTLEATRMSGEASRAVAGINSAATKYVADANISNQRFMAENYPDTVAQAIVGLGNSLTNGKGITQPVKDALEALGNSEVGSKVKDTISSAIDKILNPSANKSISGVRRK